MQRSLDALESVTPLLDQLPIGVQLLDAETRYLYLNQVAADHGRRPREQLIGRTMQECYPGIEHTQLFHHIQTTLQTGQLCELENVFDFEDGGQGWFELRIFPQKGGVVITSLDVTQRKQLQVHHRHLQRMNAARQLAGGIAHDFNNLITIVGSYAELILHDLNLTTDQRADLGEIVGASRRAAELTNRLMALSRQSKSRPKQLDLETYLPGLKRTLASALGLNIAFKLTIDDALGAIEMEPAAFEQIVVSLALNAKSVMKGTGALSITARPLRVEASSYGADRSSLTAGSYVEIAVSDDGPGISTAKLDTIFDPRLEGVERVGTGLALAMCWSLVEQAGGTILVESRVGLGSTFRVLLPRVEYRDVAAPSEVVSSYGRRAERCAKVLVLDDEPAIRQLVVRQLESVGHCAVEAVDGEDALDKLARARDFDLVVSDVLMPSMGGAELVRRMTELDCGASVLFLSGYAPDEALPPSHRHWPLLAKPFTRDRLLEAVARLIAARA